MIFIPPPERSDFHSANRSVVYRIGTVECNSNPYPIRKTLCSDSNPGWCNWGLRLESSHVISPLIKHFLISLRAMQSCAVSANSRIKS